ncbi:SET domain-containing protein SmydA-8 isoform X1 [Bactrocera neohumeralis]|uniref:SET domain-containing protein SmydA-8 isoform X1 n=1 Tax=Bactrocera tryoni TaxID=59916 RepID=UPI001A95C824|nr:SET domain-containing protein SmydA-8 isoform X1 [Bactrocera tryoni]XP_050338868.1 SET domain-containing protein SmydA-8 isoform X1 [Bactrocera neohumeralis]
METSKALHNLLNRTVVRSNSIYGRYLIAKSDTKANELLVEELPLVHGPKCNGPTVCLECYAPVNLEGCIADQYCSKCSWPLCSNCSDRGAFYHYGWECSVFSQAKAKFYPVQSDAKGCPQLDCITVLRVLLVKESDPDRWEREIAPMEYHNEERRKIVDVWNADFVNIAQYLRGPCRLAERFSEDLIMQTVGILEVNAFEARTTLGYALRCLYPITGILAHNCVPNTFRTIHPSEGFKIRLRAMCNLNEGQQLQHSYTYTLNGTSQRQEHLKNGKFFTCECKRCKDPTELGTNFSTFKCSKCEEGWLLSTNPIDPSCYWKCTLCTFQTSNNAIQKALSVMQSEVATLQAMDPSPQKLQETEKLMRKYRVVVHPLHFIQIGLRQNLIEMYGRVAEYELSELPDVMLEHKEELCRQVLHVLNVFEPGLSRTRAMMLYELHVPLVLLAKSGFISGVLTADALKLKLLDVIAILNDCVDILQYEDPETQEGNLYKVAQQAKNQLTQSVEGLTVAE